MLIDKNGKVFGKINIIDLLVLIVLVAAIIVVGARFLLPKQKNTQTIEMQFYLEEVDEWVADKISEGNSLYDGTYEVDLGTVTKVEREQSIAWGLNQNGEYVQSSRDGFCSLTITGEVEGQKTAIGAKVNGEIYGVGHSMVLYAGDAKLYLRVHDIRVKE
ncbi:MAG: DUF4330 domain-containing protein [Ruminococcaceae bacterium]|nr:DUF4330 domain-containing protein [Oscillospiraceae bacterium]